MAVDNVIDAMRQPFLDIATDVHGSIVYLDAGAAEVAQLSLGPAFLLGLGAANVCDLERCHPDDFLLYMLANKGTSPTSVAVFTTQLLPEVHQQMVHLLMVHHQVQRCTLFCAVSELAHAQLDPSICTLGFEAYSEYISALRQDLAAARLGAGLPAPCEGTLQLSVRHLPLHVAAIDTNTFVLPAAGAVASNTVSGGYAGRETSADADHDDDAVGVSTGLSLLPHCLADLSRLLGARLDPYAIGPVSLAVAKGLAVLPQGPRGGTIGDVLADGLGPGSTGAARHHAFPRPHMEAPAAEAGGTSGTVGLVLIDRSLDLATPCMHGDHVLDGIFAHLPRAAEVVWSESGPSTAGTPRGRQRVGLRPADVRIDIPQVAPLAPLTPPLTPHTQQQQQHWEEAPASPGQLSQPRPEAVTVAATSLASPMGLGLWHPADRRWLNWLQQLLPKRNKDALLLLRKWLKEALRAERISPSTRSKLSSVVAPAELAGLAQCLAEQPDVFLRHQPIVGLALAAAAALSTAAAPEGPTPFWTLWERCAAAERQLLLALPEGSQASEMLKPMLMDVIDSARQGRLWLDHVVQLLVVMYALSGDRMPPAPPLYSADEADIRDALADAIIAAAQQQQHGAGNGPLLHLDCLPRVRQLLQEAIYSHRISSDAADVRAAVVSQLRDMFQRLRWLAATRGTLRDVRRLMQVDVDTGAASFCTPLVRQVLTKILLQADNRDLQQPENSNLVAGLFNKGFGRFGFGGIGAPARPRISEYSTVLLFVIGGISPAELREIRQELDEHKFGHKPTVLFGGTTWLAPGDAARLVINPV